MFDCPPFAGASHPGLYFIYDQQDAIFVAQFAQRRVETVWWDDIAALALDGLHQYPRHLIRGQDMVENLLIDIAYDCLAVVFALFPF